MKNNSICPLLTANETIKGNDPQFVPCLKERCAWWVEDKQKCAMTAIGGKK